MVSVAIALRAPTPMSFKLRAFTMARRLARRSSSAAERQTTAPDVQGETLACDVSCDSVNGRGPGIARSMRGKRLEFCAAAQGLFCRSRTFWSRRADVVMARRPASLRDPGSQRAVPECVRVRP